MQNVRVSTVSLHGRKFDNPETARNYIIELLSLALDEQPDIVCLPECMNTIGAGASAQQMAEPLDGRSIREVSRLAREHNVNIVCPLLCRRNGKVYNSAVILNRSGEISGIYDKMYLPNISWKSIKETKPFQFEGIPGDKAEVFNLDICPIGVQICFDLHFNTGWEQLSQQNAKLVFWPSAFPGGLTLRSRALFGGYYVVSSVISGPSSVINPLGEIIERTSEWRPVTSAVLNMDYIVCYFDWHRQKVDAIKHKYGAGVTIRVLSADGFFMLQSNMEEVSVTDIAKEFAIEDSKTFFEKHEKQLAELRGKRE